MEVLNTLKELISETSKTAVKKSGDLVETTRIKFAVLGAETEISKLHREIGGMVADEYEKGGVFSPQISEKCAMAAELVAGIKDLNDRINEIRDLRECAGCSQRMPVEFSYCPRCGERLPETPVSDAAEISPEAPVCDIVVNDSPEADK